MDFFKRLLKGVLLLSLTGFLLFIALGYLVDQSEKPVKSEIIVTLGGGDGKRIKEALRLYKLGYATSHKLLYTGREIVNPALKPPERFSKSAFLKSQGLTEENIGFIKRGIIVNTAEELFFVKEYMQTHHYKSVLIVTSPIHTGRVKMLARWIVGFEEAGLSLHVSSFQNFKWSQGLYFLDPFKRHHVFLEIEKLLYNLLKYSPLTIEKTSYAKKRKSRAWREALQNI